MAHDDLDHIPSIVPTRDTVPQRTPAGARSGTGDRRRKSNRPQRTERTGGTGLLSRVLIVISFFVAALACVWSWQLQRNLQNANDQLANYAERIRDLEARLSDTDEGMNQSAAVQAVKIAELDTEVRKLWDNVWKESKERLGKLEAASASQGKSIKSVEGSLSSTQSQVKTTSDELAKLKTVAGDLARLMTSAKANQAEVERVADSLNRIELSLARLEKRVAGNEEWVASINAFRKQVNTSLSELQTTVRSMQVPH